MTRTEKRFWKRLDKRLEKQSKKITKTIRKKSAGELQYYLARHEEKDRLETQYNVYDVMPTPEGNVFERYSFYAGNDYSELFKQKINEKIVELGSFEAYLDTTLVSPRAFWCRFGKGALIAGGIALLGVAVAGGFGVGIIAYSVLANPVTYMNPISWTFVGAFLGGTPSGILATRAGAKKSCQ